MKYKNYEQWFWRLWLPHAYEINKHEYCLYWKTEKGFKGLTKNRLKKK